MRNALAIGKKLSFYFTAAEFGLRICDVTKSGVFLF